MRKQTFKAEVLDGHKGPAVIVPFDPREVWGIAPVEVESEAYGVRPGHPVKGTINGRAFEGWIGNRWDRFFILVDAALRRAAKLEVGDVVDVAVTPHAPAKPGTRKPVARKRSTRKS